MPDERLAQALAALDTALAAAPKRDGDAFSAATVAVAATRDDLAREGRATPEAKRRLTALNAVLSLIMAGHFPLGDPPWDEIRKARGWLAEIDADLP